MEIYMHSHSHGHADINEKADWLTNLGAMGEAIEGAANLFFGATVYNTVYELCNGHENEDRYGWPLYIGIVLGIISLGSAYTHRVLDTYHQTTQHRNHESPCSVEHKNISLPSDTEAGTSNHTLVEPLLPEPIEMDANESLKIKPNTPKLTLFQKFSLFGDATSHVFGRAGLLTGIVDGITDTFTKTTLPPKTRALIQLSAVFFGSATSASGIRTCWNTMLEQNKKKEPEHTHSRKI
jgi:hypothetical protein